MRLTDPIADMLSRIRNALMVKHPEVRVPHSLLKENILTLFSKEGYIQSFHVNTEGSRKDIIVRLKYTETGESVIKGLKKISKPGGRVYVNSKNIKPVLGGLGNGIVSTSKGILTIRDCQSQRIGGEYLCQIW